MVKIREKASFIQVIINPIIYKFFKDFANNRMKTNRVVAFSCRSFPKILKYMDHRRDFLRIWKTGLTRLLQKQ